MTVFYVNATLDPFAGSSEIEDLDAAKTLAVEVGHCHVFEYEITRCVPGVVPECRELVANHFLNNEEVWVREPNENEPYEEDMS